MMRDFANVAFVIAFLIIILSQITSIGVSNYGIKRLLPKLVIAAILVNISYYICAIAVDLSNILGNSLKGMLDNAAGRVDANPTNPFAEGGGVSGFMGWVAISGGILIAVGASGGWLAALALLVPLLFTALGAVIAVVVTLILRQVLIILLIVISPLAFVALLLPNTEDYFKKWRSVFQTLLLLYPIIALVFGASALASTIIMSAADSSTGSGAFDESLGGLTQTLIQLTGAAAAVIPLFIVPTLVKLAGGVLNRFAGIVNDPSKGWIDNKRNAAKERGQILKARGIQRQGARVGDPGNNVLGAPGSRRRRIYGAVTGYGINNRARARKKDLDAAENTLESTFLGSERGQQATNSAKNAQINLQNAQLNTETVRLTTTEALTLQQEANVAEARKDTEENRTQELATTMTPVALATQRKEAEMRNKDAENRLNSAALGAANTDIKMRTAVSSQDLANTEAADKQTFEELKAAGASDPALLPPPTA